MPLFVAYEGARSLLVIKCHAPIPILMETRLMDKLRHECTIDTTLAETEAIFGEGLMVFVR